MNVKVVYRGALPELTGTGEERVEAATVAEVMAHIKRKYPKEAYREAKRMLIVINGESIQLRRGYKTALAEGDCLNFLPICGGG